MKSKSRTTVIGVGALHSILVPYTERASKMSRIELEQAFDIKSTHWQAVTSR